MHVLNTRRHSKMTDMTIMALAFKYAQNFLEHGSFVSKTEQLSQTFEQKEIEVEIDFNAGDIPVAFRHYNISFLNEYGLYLPESCQGLPPNRSGTTLFPERIAVADLLNAREKFGAISFVSEYQNFPVARAVDPAFLPEEPKVVENTEKDMDMILERIK